MFAINKHGSELPVQAVCVLVRIIALHSCDCRLNFTVNCQLMYTMISCLELIFAVQYKYTVMSLHVYSYTQRGVGYNVTVYVHLCYMLCYPCWSPPPFIHTVMHYLLYMTSYTLLSPYQAWYLFGSNLLLLMPVVCDHLSWWWFVHPLITRV